MITIASVPHTGTWFVINFLEQLLEATTTHARFAEGENKITHFHVGADINRSDFGYEHLPEDEAKKTYEEYFKKFPSMEESNKLIETRKTIIPVRDPLLALITRQNRNSKLSHLLTVRGFEYISRLYGRPDIFFFPVDLYDTFEGQLRLLEKLTEFVGVENKILVDYSAIMWMARNTSHDTSGLKKEYNDGNMDAVINTLPVETECLFNTPSIKEFMSDIGYKYLKWYGAVNNEQESIDYYP